MYSANQSAAEDLPLAIAQHLQSGAECCGAQDVLLFSGAAAAHPASSRRNADTYDKSAQRQLRVTATAVLAAAATVKAVTPLRGDPCLCEFDTKEKVESASQQASASTSLRQWYDVRSEAYADSEPNSSSKSKRGELVSAIRMDSIRRSFGLLRELRAGIDAPITDRSETALAIACRAGSMQVLSALLRHGANPAMTDSAGSTCVALACAEGHLEVVRRLAQDPRADLNGRDDSGEAPVHKAVTCGHLELVHYLLSEPGGRDRVNMVTSKDLVPSKSVVLQSRLETPLHMVMRRLSRPTCNVGYKVKRYEMAELLLEYGADPTLQDGHGDTALHLCARQNDLAGLWICLVEVSDVGAASRVSNEDGLTVLEEAAAGGNRTCLALAIARLLPRSVRRWLASLMFNEVFLVLTV
eukprot:CAMPEP_0179098728 /NCGR_PEP_ID=MMETSP0796-20121207/45512_1 /TAXON_ID=73915 /ORGANISM="Pyrodinium bahamense, Strain pbaha01" /LENGTH=411 /DNA_ID=CAMNT_0020796513 /DNA_START=93 /DNA_END=1329 /DNA_ORIENTATION=+